MTKQRFYLKNTFNLLELIIFLFFGMIMGFIFTERYHNLVINTNQNGTFVLNGTDEYYWLQNMDFNRKQLIENYDLQRVIIGNFCETERGYISDITSQSFKLQCCINFTSCEGYVIVNKQIPEISLDIDECKIWKVYFKTLYEKVNNIWYYTDEALKSVTNRKVLDDIKERECVKK